MRLKHFAFGLAVVMAAPVAVTTAQAEDGIYVPLFSYRTGPYAGSGIPIANGMSDYLSMLNARDGGIGGVKLIVEECETGYDTKKGVECYELVKSRNPVVINPYSTGITLQLIPRAAVDKIPILSMAYGLSASADGNLFPWIFNPPATYWDGASAFVRHVADVEGGFDKLKGKTIGSSISMRRMARSRFHSFRRSRRTMGSSSSFTQFPERRCRIKPRSGWTYAATGPTGSICRAGGP